MGHFPQKRPIINGSCAKNDLQLKASYESSAPRTYPIGSTILTLVAIWPKSGPFPRVFWMNILALSERKHIFLKTKKADQKHCKNWHVSLVQNSTSIPECSSEAIGKNSCEISSLKVSNNPPWLRYHFEQVLASWYYFDSTFQKRHRPPLWIM